MNFSKQKSLKTCVIIMGIISMTGCSAVHTSIKKRHLDVQTKMSETIFLEPVAPSKRIVFMEIRNTSDKELSVKQAIKDRLQAGGCTLTDDPEAANYMLQANVLQIGKADLRSAEGALTSGFGGALAGAAVGAATGSSDSYGSNMLLGGLIGGAASLVGDALVSDDFFQMITDIQIRERPLKNETVIQTQQNTAKQGSSSHLNQVIDSGKVNWKIYRTRIVSTANKANLDFKEAKPVLEEGLVRSVVGMF